MGSNPGRGKLTSLHPGEYELTQSHLLPVVYLDVRASIPWGDPVGWEWRRGSAQRSGGDSEGGRWNWMLAGIPVERPSASGASPSSICWRGSSMWGQNKDDDEHGTSHVN